MIQICVYEYYWVYVYTSILIYKQFKLGMNCQEYQHNPFTYFIVWFFSDQCYRSSDRLKRKWGRFSAKMVLNHPLCPLMCRLTFHQEDPGACKLAQQLRGLVTKLAFLSSISGTPMVIGKSHLPQVTLWPLRLRSQAHTACENALSYIPNIHTE